MRTPTPTPAATPTATPSPTVTPSGATPTPTPTGTSGYLCAPTPASSFSISVKDYGAKGDGVTDDTTAIQNAFNAAGGSNGVVRIPAGTYLINPVAQSGRIGVTAKSNMTILMDSAAVLKAMSTSVSNYNVLYLSGVTNVNVIGGTVMGNRYNNTITDTIEGGNAISIVGGSTNIVIENVIARDAWEDGFYLGSAQVKNISFCGVTADGNRRQGMSVTDADGVFIKNSTFSNSPGLIENGSLVCGAGIDIEPNVGTTVNNVQILNSTFTNNVGGGVADGPPISMRGSAWTTNIVIDGNTFTSNSRAGVELSNTSGGHQVTNNRIQNTNGQGILIRNGVTGAVVTANTITGSTSYGIEHYDSGKTYNVGDASGSPSGAVNSNNLSNNTISNNALNGIYLAYDWSPIVLNNFISNNLKCGIRQSNSVTPTLSGNTQVGNGASCQ